MNPPGIKSRRTWRQKIAARFVAHPLLFYLVHSFLHSWRAQIAVTACAAFIFAALIALPKIWRTTPKGFTPEVKISLLDEIQARQLEGKAKIHLAGGQLERALMGYSAALAQNPGSLDRQRAFLSLATRRQIELGRAQIDPINIYALRTALQIHKRSESFEDIALIAAFYDVLEFDDELIALLEKNSEPPPAGLQKLLARAHFRRGNLDRFQALWQRAGVPAKWDADPEMALYHAAATIVLGHTGDPVSAKEFLDSRLREGDHKILANRLRAFAAFEQKQTAEYLACLDRLVDGRADRIRDHAGAWKLLASTGRKEDAIARANAFNRAPGTPGEARILAAAYAELGNPKEAVNILAPFLDEFSFLESLWYQQGLNLSTLGDWTELRKLAVEMRLQPHIGHRMEGFSYFLLGLCDLREGHSANAQEMFTKIPLHGVPNLEAALMVAEQLRRYGRPDLAAGALEKSEPSGREYPLFWKAAAQAAGEARNEALFLKANEQFARLRPNDPLAQNNLAAGLLVTRQRPAEALELTTQLLAANSSHPAFQMNHAGALALNGRYQESRQFLNKIDSTRLGALEISMLNFVLTESWRGESNLTEARAAAARVDEKLLFPSQRAALQQWRTQMESSAN